jgi:DNA-binding CsgD family transcriptional regulator
MSIHRSYSLFFKFLDKYSSAGYTGIDPNDPLIMELEEMMEARDQFFYIADLIQVKVIYSSKRCKEMIGIEPSDLTLYHLFEATHPQDMQRNSLGRAKVLKMAHDLFVDEKGFKIISTNFKVKNQAGYFAELLMQLYLFYSTIPYKSAYLLKIHTGIDRFKKIKHGYHYYLGEDLSYFRYPDEDLLQTGNIFSDREFEILRLVESGLSSEQIADKLFLSLHTVNTHRRNILKKTGKAHISELIYDLTERGLL